MPVIFLHIMQDNLSLYYHVILFFFLYKPQQLKEVLYDGLDKMPLKDGKK